MEPSPRKSRKPSAGPPAPPPETPVFFIDRDTGGRVEHVSDIKPKFRLEDF